MLQSIVMPHKQQLATRQSHHRSIMRIAMLLMMLINLVMLDSVSASCWGNCFGSSSSSSTASSKNDKQKFLPSQQSIKIGKAIQIEASHNQTRRQTTNRTNARNLVDDKRQQRNLKLNNRTMQQSHQQPTRATSQSITELPQTLPRNKSITNKKQESKRPQPMTLEQHINRERQRHASTKPRTAQQQREAEERKIHAYFDDPATRTALLVTHRRAPDEKKIETTQLDWEQIKDAEQHELHSPGWAPFRTELWRYFNHSNQEYRKALRNCQAWLNKTRAFTNNTAAQLTNAQFDEFLKLVQAVFDAHPRDQRTPNNATERARNILHYHVRDFASSDNQHDKAVTLMILALHIQERIP
jgi:hypothetical protein